MSFILVLVVPSYYHLGTSQALSHTELKNKAEKYFVLDNVGCYRDHGPTWTSMCETELNFYLVLSRFIFSLSVLF